MRTMTWTAVALSSGAMSALATTMAFAQITPARPVPAAAGTPSPATVLVNQPVKRLDVPSLQQARLATMRRGKVRTFKPPGGAVIPPAHQDVRVGPSGMSAERLSGGSNAALPCTRIGMLIERVTGDVTPGGNVTLNGTCFGSQGDVRMSGQFQGGPVALEVQSWTDSTITARVPQIYAVPDQPVDIAVVAPRTVYSKNVQAATRAASAPVRLNFVAIRETIDITRPVTNTSCAQGDVVRNDYYQGQPDSCGSPNWTDCGPQFGYENTGHRCTLGWHFRPSAGSGSDGYTLRLQPGWRLDAVDLVYSEQNDEGKFSTYTNGYGSNIAFSPTADFTTVSWAVNWTATSARYDVIGSDFKPRTLFFYFDGSYMLHVSVTGPRGTWPAAYVR